MKLQIFPKRQLTFRTALTEAEVLERLETHLRQVESGNIDLLADRFVGEVKGNAFFIHERIGFRGDSFVPGIRGMVERDERGTIIRITMQLGGCIRIFVLVWCYVPLLFLFLSVVTFFREGTFNPTFLVMIIPLLVMYWMMHGGFKAGSETARAFIATTFEAEHEQVSGD